MKIAYILNNISTTSIPLEIGSYLKKKGEISFKIICFYKERKNSKELLKRFGYDPDDVVFINFNKKKPIMSIKLFVDEIKRLKPDIIHTHHTFSAFLARLIGKFNSVRVISTIHGEYFRYTFYQKLLHIISINFADSIICNSKSTKASLKWVLNKTKVKVIYNGVPVDAILKSKSRYNKIIKLKDHYIIGTVGRIVEIKRHKDIIDAFSKLLKTKDLSKNIKLLVIGDGPLRQSLQSYTRKIGLEKYVIFVGEVEREKVYSLLNELDLFIMASKSEGFCNALVEAMAAKKNLLLSDINIFREITEENNQSIFFKLGNIDELAEKMWAKIINPVCETELNRRFNLVVNKYSLEKCADLYFHEYKKLVN